MRVDLHAHTALSACAENSMAPGEIVARAKAANLGMLAVTDHNASANVAAAVAFGRQSGVKVVPGMEITTREEVHVLALFDALPALWAMQEIVDRALPEQSNPAEFFGLQLIYDGRDEIVDVDERLRQIGLNLSLESVICEIRKLGGHVVPAHVLRRKHSLSSQLGFMVEGADFDAVEVSRRDWIRDGYRLGRRLAGYPVVTASDAHFLDDVGRHFMDVPGDFATVGQVLAAIERLTV